MSCDIDMWYRCRGMIFCVILCNTIYHVILSRDVRSDISCNMWCDVLRDTLIRWYADTRYGISCGVSCDMWYYISCDVPCWYFVIWYIMWCFMWYVICDAWYYDIWCNMLIFCDLIYHVIICDMMRDVMWYVMLFIMLYIYSWCLSHIMWSAESQTTVSSRALPHCSFALSRVDVHILIRFWFNMGRRSPTSRSCSEGRPASSKSRRYRGRKVHAKPRQKLRLRLWE